MSINSLYFGKDFWSYYSHKSIFLFIIGFFLNYQRIWIQIIYYSSSFFETTFNSCLKQSYLISTQFVFELNEFDCNQDHIFIEIGNPLGSAFLKICPELSLTFLKMIHVSFSSFFRKVVYLNKFQRIKNIIFNFSNSMGCVSSTTMSGKMLNSLPNHIYSSQYLQFLFQQMKVNPLPANMIDIEVFQYIKNISDKYYWAEEKKNLLIQALEQFLKKSIVDFGDSRSIYDRKKINTLTQDDSSGFLLGQAISKLANQVKLKSQWILESLDFQKELKDLTFDLQNQVEAEDFSVKVMRQCDKQMLAIFYLSSYFMKCCQKMEKEGVGLTQIMEKLRKKVTKLKDDFSIKGAKLAEEKYLFKKGKEEQKILESQFKSFKKEYEVTKFKLSGDFNQKEQQLQINIEGIIEMAKRSHEAFDNIFKRNCINNNGYGYKSNLKLYSMSNKMGLIRVKQKLLERFIKDEYQNVKGNIKICSTINQQVKAEQSLFNEILLKIYEKIEDIQFSVTDMLRGKCMFNKVSQINSTVEQVMKQVQQQKKKGKDIQIVQIVNRFQGEKVVTKDLMLKIRVQSLVCQFQMALSFSTSQNEIHHKMYELVRAKTFSPLFMLSQWNKKATKEYFSTLRKCLKFQTDQRYEEKANQLMVFVEYKEKDEQKINEEEYKYKKEVFSRDVVKNSQDPFDKIANTIDFWFEMSQYEKAESIYEKLQKNYINQPKNKISQRMLTVMQKIGDMKQKQGNYQQALQIYKKCLNYKDKDSIDSALTLNSIGSLYSNLGQYDDAISYYNSCLTIYDALKGKQSIDSASILNNIGSVYIRIGKYEDALNYYNRCIKIQQAIKGKQSIDCASTLNNIGSVYNSLGKYDDALSCYSRSLKIEQTIKGKDTIDCALILNNIGLLYSNLGKYDDALSYYNRSLKIQSTFKSINCAPTLTNIGLVYTYLGKYEDALNYYNRCLIIQEATTGKQSIDCALTLNSIGSVYINLRKYEDALSYCNKSLLIQQKVKGMQSIDCALILNNIGLVYKNLGQYDDALFCYNRCLKIEQAVKGKQSIDCASTLNNIGLVYNSLGKYDDALTYFNSSLKIKQAIKGKDSIDCASTLNNIGLLYQNLCQYDNALNCYNKCLQIKQAIKGKNSIDCTSTLSNIGLVYRNLGKYEDSLKYYNKCLIIIQNLYGQYSTNCIKPSKNILYCYQKLGMYEKYEQLQKYIELIEIQNY